MIFRYCDKEFENGNEMNEHHIFDCFCIYGSISLTVFVFMNKVLFYIYNPFVIYKTSRIVLTSKYD